MTASTAASSGAPGPTGAPASTDAPADAEVVPAYARRRDGWGTFWNAVLIVDLVILALLFLSNLAVGLLLLVAPESAQAQRFAEAARGVTTEGLWFNTALTFLLVGIVPLAWAFGSRVRPWEGGLRYLRLKQPWPAAGKGAGYGLLLVLGVVVLSALYTVLVHGSDALNDRNTTIDSPLTEGIFGALTWPLALFIALAAGFGEEVFFRGILQKHLGLWGQAVLFGVTHAGYGTVLQLVIPFAIGLLFGYWIKRGASLWMPIAAHFTYNFTQLALALVAREQGWG